jgi:hypothetical protein
LKYIYIAGYWFFGFQELARRLQQEQQTVASERLHVSALTIQNRDLQTELVAANQKIYDLEEIAQSRSVTIPLTDASIVDTATSRKDKVKNQLDLAELASMVERQEQGRQKLLAEVCPLIFCLQLLNPIVHLLVT